MSRGSFWGGHTSKSRLQAPGVWCACNTKVESLWCLPPGRWPIGAVSRQACGRTPGVGDTAGGPLPLRIQEESAGPLCLRGTWAKPLGVLLRSTHECPQMGLIFITVVQSSKNIKLGAQTNNFISMTHGVVCTIIFRGCKFPVSVRKPNYTSTWVGVRGYAKAL